MPCTITSNPCSFGLGLVLYQVPTFGDGSIGVSLPMNDRYTCGNSQWQLCMHGVVRCSCTPGPFRFPPPSAHRRERQTNAHQHARMHAYMHVLQILASICALYTRLEGCRYYIVGWKDAWSPSAHRHGRHAPSRLAGTLPPGKYHTTWQTPCHLAHPTTSAGAAPMSESNMYR